MQKFLNDDKNGLIWKKFSSSQDDDKMIRDINCWHSDNIKKYVNNYGALGSNIVARLGSMSNLYFCQSGKDLVGLLHLHFNSIEYAIEDIVVNPDFQGKGYGTLMIKSFRENPEFFGSIVLRGRTIVHKDNIASKNSLSQAIEYLPSFAA